MTDSSAAPISATHRAVDPSEVGWQFVPEYYNYINKQPDRLHLFYTKKSTFIHGTEGEDVKACHGQQEIHAKIKTLNFQGCKVFIHSVDALSSMGGGIMIQVIGEMSNNNEAWRKFVQTFFLAEQPNGYFVLNDIFRFLREDQDSDAGSDTEAAVAEPLAVPAVETLPQQPEEQAPSQYVASFPAREPTPPPPAPEVQAPQPVEEPTTVSDVPEPPSQVVAPSPEPARPNGIHHQEPEQKPATPVPAAAVSLPEKSKSPAPPPPAAPATATPPPAAAAPSAPAPAAPKTWATLAAANPKKWGANVAQESRGTTEAVSSSSPASGASTPAVQHAPSGPAGGAPQGRSAHPAYVAAQSVTTPHCFVKGVVEPLSNQQLSSYLTSRFGPLKDLDVVRSKACAFFEFNSVESARKAITASLPVSAGGEGGLFIEVSGAESGQVRIVVETKKERGERPVSRPRGGAPGNSDGRGGPPISGGGSFRGRGGGRGRGGPPK